MAISGVIGVKSETLRPALNTTSLIQPTNDSMMYFTPCSFSSGLRPANREITSVSRRTNRQIGRTFSDRHSYERAKLLGKKCIGKYYQKLHPSKKGLSKNLNMSLSRIVYIFKMRTVSTLSTDLQWVRPNWGLWSLHNVYSCAGPVSAFHLIGHRLELAVSNC